MKSFAVCPEMERAPIPFYFTVWQVDNLDINNLDNIQWKVGPTYNLKRQYAGCGIVKSDQHGGRPLLVVAGGNGDSASKKTSEYLDFTLDGPTWKLLSKFFFFFDGEVLLGFSNPGLLLLSLF